MRRLGTFLVGDLMTDNLRNNVRVSMTPEAMGPRWDGQDYSRWSEGPREGRVARLILSRLHT